MTMTMTMARYVFALAILPDESSKGVDGSIDESTLYALAAARYNSVKIVL